MGKMKRAGTIFASARNAASKSAASTLSIEQRVDFELRYALYLAAIGNTTKRYVSRYTDCQSVALTA